MSASSENQAPAQPPPPPSQQPSAAVVADPPLKREQENGDEEARKRSKKNHEYNDLVSVLIGPEEVSYTVHEHFICAKSKFFWAACREQWIGGTESPNRVIRLPNARPGTFRYYLNWVYTSDVVIEIEDDACGPNGIFRRAIEQDRLIKLYVLGDVLDDLRLRNRVLKDLLNINETPFPRSVTWAYEHTPTTSNLRGVLVRLACHRWNRTVMIKKCASYHHEFVRALAVLLLLETKQSVILPHPLPMLPDHLEDESNA
jgi:hypothetical protein